MTTTTAHHHALIDSVLGRLPRRSAPATRRDPAARPRPPQRRRILFESLEPRLLMSADLLPQASPGEQAQAPAEVRYDAASTRIQWSAPASTASEAALFTNNVVASFDLDNFSSPLAPVQPAGSLVHAGGVQGTLDADGDSDTLQIELNAGQSFTLRVQPAQGLRASVEAFDPQGNSLGLLEAANPGDALVLQSRPAAQEGSYGIEVGSLAGSGAYTVEIFLNAMLEDADTTGPGDALVLDGGFSQLLDSNVQHAAVIGQLQSTARLLGQQDFEDIDAFFGDPAWQLGTDNEDAFIGVQTSGAPSNSSLLLGADRIATEEEREVDIGDGVTETQTVYLYDASLSFATWQLDLTGATGALLEFDAAGYDPLGDDAAQGSQYQGTAGFDGVSVSVDGEHWIVLASFGAHDGNDAQAYQLDLVQALAAHGLVPTTQTLLRFQMYDAGGEYGEPREELHRLVDNVRVTSGQTTQWLSPVAVTTPGTQDVDYFNDLAGLSDGIVPAQGIDWDAVTNVAWYGQEAGYGSGGGEVGASDVDGGLYFDLDLGSAHRVDDLLLSVDGNDDYAVDYSLDGVQWTRLLSVWSWQGQADYGMDTFSSDSQSTAYVPELDFDSVQARYLRVYATGGDGAYAIGELKATSQVTEDAEDWYMLSLQEGEGATFTLTHEHAAAGGNMLLSLYDEGMNLLTESLASAGSGSVAIDDLRVPASGTYHLRVTGSVPGEYSLVGVRNALFGAGTQRTQDLSQTPTVLDAVAGRSGTIRVAVLEGGNLLDQLNDSSAFSFEASYVSYHEIDTLEELQRYDVVVLGYYPGDQNLQQIAPTLRSWAEMGHGVVTTGWTLYDGSLRNGEVIPDLDAVVPLNLQMHADYLYGGSGNASITITDATHPVTRGITSAASAYYYDYLVVGTGGVDDGATVLGSSPAGYPTVIVGQPGAGRSVALSPDYAGGSRWNEGAADRLLEQAVAWAAGDANRYSVQARAGTDLQVTLDTLLGGTGQPTTGGTPELALYDTAGNLLASGAGSLSHAVAEDDLFFIEVSGGTDAYLLRVAGDLVEESTPLEVLYTSLDGVGELPYAPGAIDILFGAPLLLTSIDASDFVVDGVAASGFEILSHNLVRFYLGDAFPVDGSYQLQLVEGSLSDIHGNTNTAWSGGLDIDRQGPRITGTDLAQGAQLPTGAHDIQVSFDDDLDTSYLDPEDLLLYSAATGTSAGITNYSYDSGSRTLTLTTPALGEGAYTLRLVAGYHALRDFLGNALDGNGDGQSGDDFLLDFSVDVDTVAYPPMAALPPLGSLVYGPGTTGYANGTGDVDTYTVSLSPGQLLGAIAATNAPDLQLGLRLRDAEGNVVAEAAGTEGIGAALQTLSGLEGDYSIDIRSLSGSGSYAFSLVLNALLEPEMLDRAAANDDLASAQDLGASALVVGADGGDRLAVIGDRAPGSAEAGDADHYRISLQAGQAASVVLALTPGSNGALRLELLDGAGNVVAVGVDSNDQRRQSIADYVAPATGTYYLRVSGEASGQYNLVATRGISLAMPPTAPGVTAQDISVTGEVLGNSALSASTDKAAYLYSAYTSAPWNSSTNNQAMDNAFGAGQWDLLRFETVDVAALLASHSVLFLEGSDSNANELETFLGQHLAALEAWVARGNTLFINAAPNEGNGMALGFGGVTLRYSDSSGSGSIVDTSHPIFQGPYTPVIATYSGSSFTHASVNGGGITPLITDNTGDAVLAELSWGGGTVLFGGMTTTNFHSPQPAASNLRANILAYAASKVQSGGAYSVQIEAGETLTATITLPGQGDGEPGNTLVPTLELFGPDGEPVAFDAGSGDGSWSFTATTTGRYELRVGTASGTGDYVLRVSGMAASTPPAPTVFATDPEEGKTFTAFPGSITLDLSEYLLATSLEVGDLIIDGDVTVTGVQMVDGNTVRFLLSVPEGSGEGPYQYSLAAGSLLSLQGAGNAAYAGSFSVDLTPPRVVSQTPELQSNAPFNTWSLTFNEALETSTVQTGDFTLQHPDGYSIYLYSATVSQDGRTVTLSFDNQYSEGQYTLTVGTGIQDLAGNSLDQDAAADGLQPYEGTVQVASPDLQPITITVTQADGTPLPAEGAALGSQVKITWTVRNIGTDAARAGGWYDSLYLSTSASTSGALLLGDFYVSSELAAGGQYTNSATVTLPLNNNLNSGAYYVRVQADRYNYQPEHDDSNNALYTEALALVVPPLPDLQVGDVVAPAIIEANKNATITWTVRNEGEATAASPYGYWYDRVVLSADNVFGNGDDVYLWESYYFTTIEAGAQEDRSATVNIGAGYAGTWNVLVKTDYYNYVYERSNEDNNVGTAAQQVQVIVPTEDLVPKTLNAADAAVFGSTISVDWTVRNDGTGPTYANWYDRLYLSTDATLDGNDIVLSTVWASDAPAVRPLAAGEQYTRNIQGITLPLNVNLAEGSYYLLLKTDAGEHEPELNDNNNVLSRAITLALADYADLRATDVSVPQPPVHSGEDFTVHFTLRNDGEAAAANFRNTLWLSSDGVNLTHYVGEHLYNQSLAAGASVEVSQTIKVPLYEPGNWYVVVVADYNNAVYEHAGENNNRGITAAPITTTLPPLPDLVVSNISMPEEALAGEAITYSWTITNQGTADYTGIWHDRVYLANTTNGGLMQDFGSFAFEGTLAAGASITRTQNIVLSPTQDGPRRLVVTTDYHNEVNETPAGNTNNTTTDDDTLVISYPPLPDLRVTAVTPPTDPASGTDTVVTWVVTNTGTGATSSSVWYDEVRLSLNDIWGDGDDISFGIVANPNYLTVGESYQGSRTISLPKGLAGDYHFMVRTDIYNQVFEDQHENDNTFVSPLVRIALTPPPDLRVDTVEAQNLAFSGQPLAISWTVSNHGQGRTAEASWYDRVIMSANDILGDADDRHMGDFWHTGALDADASYTVNKTLNLPIGVVGDFHFFVLTDHGNHVYEHGSDNNNTRADMLPDGTGLEATTIQLTPPPDLEVYSVSGPSAGEAGHLYAASWRVVNFGATATPNNYWVDRLYLSLDGVLDATDIALGERARNGALDRYEEDADGNAIAGFYDASISFTLPFALEGNYRLIVRTDVYNQVFEGFDNPTGPDGEDNNTWASGPLAIVSRPADLVVDAVTAPTSGEAGKQVSVTWTVRNAGTGDSIANRWFDQVRVSFDDILGDDDDIVLTTLAHNGALAAGQSYARTEAVTLPFGLATGSYRIYVLTDVQGNVYESNDNNNRDFAAIQVTRQTPDLQVTSVEHEAEGMVALPLDVSWRVENRGANTTNANNWYDEVWLSLDGVLDGNDILLGQRYRNAALAVDGGYDVATSFTLPTHVAPGDYHVLIRTDRDNAVTEGTAGEANNVRASAGKVHVAAFDPNNPDGVLPIELLRPNLTVTGVSAPDTAISGQTMQVSWTVKNDSTDPTGNRSWYDAVYLSRDGVLDRNSDLYVGYVYHANVGAGQSYTQTLDIKVPWGQSGPFHVFVATDSGRHITESDELDNVGQKASFTQVSLAPPADLVVGTMTLPVNGIPGTQATISFTVQNQGVNPALGSWQDSVYLSLDDVWDINDQLFGVVTHHGDVAGGTGYTSTLTAALPGLTPGDYKVIVRSDIRNYIPESNENNNIGASLVSVALDVEELVLGTPDTGTLGNGQAVYYKIEVGAGETIRLHLDSQGTDIANMLYVRHGHMPTRGQFDFSAGEGFVTDPELVIPTTEAGTYYVMVYGQAVAGNPAYTIRADIIPFSITDVEAEKVGNSGDVTLRIDGAKFGAGTVFSLVAPDGTRIDAHQLHLDNSSAAFATFSLFGAAVGPYDVVATQADGSSVQLADALQVAADFDAAVFLSIAGPTQVMVGRANIFTLDYVNDGGTDVMAPLMVLQSYSATPMGLTASELRLTPIHLIAASYDGPMDVLRPGARYSIPIVFQSPQTDGAMDIRVGRILATDTRLIEDWDALEASIRPTNLTDAEWGEFWGRIKPLIGLTWGEYVQVLNIMMKQVSEPGEPVRDVRQVFARMHELNPDFVPYASLAGEVRNAETDQGLADVQMTAYLVREDGSLEYKASAISDAEGHYRFTRLTPGEYKVVAIGRALDMDRDGQVDLDVPTVQLGEVIEGSAGIVYIQPLAAETHNDTNPELNRDSNGVTHMVWTRDGLVWHSWFDAASGQWRDAQAISTEDAYGVTIASSDVLFRSASNVVTGGTIVAWQQGKGNDAEIWYAVARAKAGGGFEWSTPVQLTDDDTLDVAPQIIITDGGLVLITHLKKDGEIQDDTDIYYQLFALAESDFIWPVAVDAVDAQAAATDTPLATEGVSVAYGRQWKFGPWDVFGTSAELVLALTGQISEADCKATLGAQGQIQGSFKGESIRSTVTGNGSVTAEWGVNEASKDWLFNGAKASVGAQAQFDWRYGLSTLLGKIPHPAVTSAHFMYTLAVALGQKVGLEFEDGITFGGGINFSVLEWKMVQPFPEFVWPDGIFEVDVTGTFGLYAQLDIAATGDSVRLQGDLTVSLGIQPEFKIKSVTGNITFSGNIGWMPFNEVFSVTLYNNQDAEVLSADAQTATTYIPIFDADALIGTGNVYGNHHVVADVANDVTSDSAMTMAKDDGVIFGAWTRMADPHADHFGWDVMVAEFGGSWGTPVALDGSRGVNSFATAAVDGLGRRMVIWTHADSSNLSDAPTLEEYEAALDASDLVYALYDEATGTWSAMQGLASTEGMDSGIAVSHDAAGRLVMTWVIKGTDGEAGVDRVMTATWDGAAWSPPTEVAFGASITDPEIERLGDGLMVVWEQDMDPDPDRTQKTLFYSTWSGTAWSAGATFDPIAMATGLALSAGLQEPTLADIGLTTESGFPPFPVPEECLKCKPEDIKRITESVPTSGPGYTVVTFDPNTCTEKTIIYVPQAVRPRDPNDIIGPASYGDEAWVAANSTLNYMIRFENAADASAPAQQVVITQQLDDDLDWRTFRIDDFGFGDQIVEIDGKNAFYQKRLDFTADPARGFYLDVSAAVDITTGIVTWTLTTIDPATGEMPQDATIGFLPVNDVVYDENHEVVTPGTGRGEGYVTYTIKARRDVESGTVIDAQARIVFDTEEPIDTPAIFHTLDAGLPESAVIAFAEATTDQTEFTVRWGGVDNDDGAGIRDYTVYVSVDGGDFEVWRGNTTLTEAVYVGAAGHSYSFYSTARDYSGNQEAAPATADATILVAGGAGSITGTQFDDTDGDGVRDVGEAGLAGWTIFLDTDGDGELDEDERSTLTDADGNYRFDALVPGGYTVRVVDQPGWLRTAPAADGSHTVTVLTDTESGGLDFGRFAHVQIGGQHFNDLDADGVHDAGEGGLAGWTVQLDRNADGSIDATTVTDADGNYVFVDLGPGSYRISVVAPAGWLLTGPGSHTVTATSGLMATGQQFSAVRAASISGTKFEDVNGNGQRDAGENGLAGWTIFLDTNANGSLDAGERFAVTGADGSYRIDALLPGAYTVAEVMQDGWTQTSPGTGVNQLDTTLTLNGDAVLSLPADVVVSEQALTPQATSANSMADQLVGLDAFRNDGRFAGIDGRGVSTVVIDTGIDLNHSWFGPDLDGDGVADRIVYSWDFADGDADASDRNGHGSHVASIIGGQDATYGGVAQGADIIALKVFADNGAGYFSYLERALRWVIDNAENYGVGVINLSLGDGGNWNTAIGRYGLADELATLASMDILITAASGNNYHQFGGAMGVAYPAADPAVLAVGAVWGGGFGGPFNYANGAADYGTAADRLAAFGQRDGELLDVLAPGTRMVGANYNGGMRTMFGTSQASAYMAGVATLAQDLALEHLGRRLGMAEFTALLASTSVWVMDGDDEYDNVANTGLEFARIDMLALAEGILALDTTPGPGTGTPGGSGPGTTPTGPLAASGVHQVTLTAGEDQEGVDFGNFALGSIAGHLFHDLDADQLQAVLDNGLAGWTVFLDADNDGQLDVGEHSSLTDADGRYAFDDIGPGSFRVTVLNQAGWTATTALARDITMTSGLAASADFGVNATPALDAIDDVQVNEGHTVTVQAGGQDLAGDTLVYSLVGDSFGATIDASTGAFHWLATDGDATHSFTVRVTDSAGAVAERSFTVTVDDVAPTLQLQGAASATQGQDYVLTLSATDPGQDTITAWTVHWGDGSSTVLEGAGGALTHRYANAGNFTVQVTATDEDGTYAADKSVVVAPMGTLKVSSFQTTATGFHVGFNRAIDVEQLNLYSAAFQAMGTSDLALKDSAGKLVAGSIVVDADQRGFTFVKTGGLLANGNYTLTLDSRANAFVDTSGGLLDGNGNNVAGDAWTRSFTISGAGAVLSIGEFARGPGQAVGVPTTSAGFPVTITGATGARELSFTLAYDAGLLQITGVTGGSGLPAGSTIQADFGTPGQVRVTLQLSAALTAGATELVRLVATVPTTAPYGASQVLDLRDIVLDTGAAVREDDGLQVVAFLGDATGNADYGTLDVQRIQRVVLRQDTGFGAWPTVDPVVIADIHTSGSLTALDVQRMLSEVSGIDREEIPPLPAGHTPLVFSGDQRALQVAHVEAQAGDTVVVPVTLDDASGLEAVELVLAYPAEGLELVDVRLGGVAQGFTYVVKDSSVPGRVTIDMARTVPLAAGAGNLLELEFRVREGAQGTLTVDLHSARLNDSWLSLEVAPQVGADASDGAVVLPAPEPEEAPVVDQAPSPAMVEPVVAEPVVVITVPPPAPAVEAAEEPAAPAAPSPAVVPAPAPEPPAAQVAPVVLPPAVEAPTVVAPAVVPPAVVPPAVVPPVAVPPVVAVPVAQPPDAAEPARAEVPQAGAVQAAAVPAPHPIEVQHTREVPQAAAAASDNPFAASTFAPAASFTAPVVPAPAVPQVPQIPVAIVAPVAVPAIDFTATADISTLAVQPHEPAGSGTSGWLGDWLGGAKPEDTATSRLNQWKLQLSPTRPVARL